MRRPLLPFPLRRSGRVRWGALAFLLVFTILLVFVCRYYLFPALQASRAPSISDADRRKLKAWATLVLALMLFVLLAGLLLTLRIGRFFFPRAAGPRVRTKHVDIWAEAGKRMETPPKDA